MMRTFAVAAITLLALGGPTPAASGQLGQIGGITGAVKRANDVRELQVTDAEEAQLGTAVSERIRIRYGVVQDEAVHRYIALVGTALAQASTRPTLPWTFIVLDTDGVNAFAAPGGYVHITRGALALLQTEAELAGVLGHEIVHVLRKHHLKAIQKGAQTALAGDAMSMALRERGGAARDKLIALGTEMYSRGLDKSDELEADRLGVVIAARGGYDSYGLPSVLQTLQAMNAEDSALALMFKTHPTPAERLDTLGQMQSVLDSYSRQPQLADRFLREIRK